MIDYADIIHTISISLLHSLYSRKENVIHIASRETVYEKKQKKIFFFFCSFFEIINEIKMKKNYKPSQIREEIRNK